MTTSGRDLRYLKIISKTKTKRIKNAKRILPLIRQFMKAHKIAN